MVRVLTMVAVGASLITILYLASIVFVQQIALQRSESVSVANQAAYYFYETTTTKTVTTQTLPVKNAIVNCVSIPLGYPSGAASNLQNNVWEIEFIVSGPGTLEIEIGLLSRDITGTISYPLSSGNSTYQTIQWAIPTQSATAMYQFEQYLPLSPGPHTIVFRLEGIAHLGCLNLGWVHD